VNILINDQDYGKTSGAVYNAVLGVYFSGEATTEPVTLDEAKGWLKISDDITDDDTVVTELITVARQMCEKYSNISFITRTVKATLRNTLGSISLPYGPHGAIASYKDYNGTDVSSTIVKGDQFKVLYEPCIDYIEVTYLAGYATLPYNLKRAVLCQVAYLYENRGDATAVSQLSPDAKTILKQVSKNAH